MIEIPCVSMNRNNRQVASDFMQLQIENNELVRKMLADTAQILSNEAQLSLSINFLRETLALLFNGLSAMEKQIKELKKQMEDK